MDVIESSRVLDVSLSEWCCSVSMVWVQIPSREELKFDSNLTQQFITDLVCCTNLHWFFNPECQHKFEKQTEYIFQSPKNDKNMDDKKYASLNQKHILRNNKCIFTKLNNVFILKTTLWQKKILQQIILHKYQIDSANSFIIWLQIISFLIGWRP